MKTLPQKFTKNGFTFAQVARDGDIAVYSKSRGNHVGYDVVVIHEHNGYQLSGKTVEPAEYMPSSESCGKYGWTHQDLPSALRRYQELLRTCLLHKHIAQDASESAGRVKTAENVSERL